MKLALSTLFLTLATLRASAAAPASEPDAACAAYGLEARQNPNWYGIRDVSRIALERLNGGVTDAINLANEVSSAVGLVPGLGQAMQGVHGRYFQLNSAPGSIHAYALSVVGS
jgi:hypothetical protein